MSNIEFVLMLYLIPLCLVSFLVSGVLQYLFPRIKLYIIILSCYLVVSLYLWYRSWIVDWTLLSFVAGSSMIAISLVMLYMKVYRMAEKKANEMN
ncbi:hypothetical protein QUF49_15185 [Fictibacillus sp. b24]|uniref:hypothetical protein n=1 Tax=Fictibacillus sp. b24 TaxID=3055863 RepID=UPI0025A2430F|nr:hypothetical protein [Fictibacillus sp. b24]MDM5317353.1 hypothetical protein [Fictibacillus sp. b24]